ncbi:MAG: CocE/NonD family hydrolase [Gracilibacteraceae bacterium]|jgi:predicted acyl esterase|nr:CocE/NonD family hydrolase [Gracilibacteraceae bacterium]
MAFTYRFRDPIHSPLDFGGCPPNYRRYIEGGMLVERDVQVMMRDGARINVDLFRPADENLKVPPLIAWSPYGKHISTTAFLSRAYPTSGVDLDSLSKYTCFESPDPVQWVPKGYAVIVADIRGMWHSEGNATYISPKEMEDEYDLIEWAGTQPWSSGKVGLSGVSYLAVSQWRVAALNPPHLAAINPWEGWSDTYREVIYHGGIPSSFWPYMHDRWGKSTTRIEDLLKESEEHPFFDDYWRSKAAQLGDIKVPAYVVASWSDHGLHTRGTLEGFKKISSERKWLEVHGRKKWAYYYDPASLKRQTAFFDHILKGVDNEVLDWPRVNLEVRQKYYVGFTQTEKEWPIARTKYTKFYLNAEDLTLNKEAPLNPAQCSYNALGVGSTNNCLTFSYKCEESMDLIGHMKLKVYMQADGSDDMDIFLNVKKLNEAGEETRFAYYAQYDDGPVACGWIRASHRELLEELTTEFQPILAHQREQKLEPGSVECLNIEILPSGTRFEKGETLCVAIQGHDFNQYPIDQVYARHDNNTVNKGRHIIYAGGIYDSYLLVPIIPKSGTV